MFGVKQKEKPETPKEHNCFIIEPGTDKGLNGKAYFDYVENPPGMPRQCLNNSNQYKLLIKANGSVAPLKIPEKLIYFDPQEYINALQMPCNGKYFGWADDFWQKISIGAMVVVIVIEVIGFALVGS